MLLVFIFERNNENILYRRNMLDMNFSYVVGVLLEIEVRRLSCRSRCCVWWLLSSHHNMAVSPNFSCRFCHTRHLQDLVSLHLLSGAVLLVQGRHFCDVIRGVW